MIRALLPSLVFGALVRTTKNLDTEAQLTVSTSGVASQSVLRAEDLEKAETSVGAAAGDGMARKVACSEKLAQQVKAVELKAGDWTLGECLGAGAFGEAWTIQGDPGKIAKVWKATSESAWSKSGAAAKAECDFAQQATASPLKAHFVACFGSGTLEIPEAAAFAVFERVQGADLEALAQEGKLDPQFLAQLGQVVLQMQEPDAQGRVFFHPDLQLSNLMLREAGQVVLVDYDNCVACCSETCDEQLRRLLPSCTLKLMSDGLYKHAYYLVDDWMAANIVRSGGTSGGESADWRTMLPPSGPHEPRSVMRMLDNFQFFPQDMEGLTEPDTMRVTPIGKVMVQGTKVPSAEEMAVLLKPHLLEPYLHQATVAWLRASKQLAVYHRQPKIDGVQLGQIVSVMRNFRDTIVQRT